MSVTVATETIYKAIHPTVLIKSETDDEIGPRIYIRREEDDLPTSHVPY